MRLLQTPKTKKAPQPHPAKHQNRRTEPHGIKQACHIHTHTHMYLYIYICTYTHIYIYIDIAALSRMRQFVFVFVPCLANLVQLPLHRSFRFFFSSSGGPNWPASKEYHPLNRCSKIYFQTLVSRSLTFLFLGNKTSIWEHRFVLETHSGKERSFSLANWSSKFRYILKPLPRKNWKTCLLEELAGCTPWSTELASSSWAIRE